MMGSHQPAVLASGFGKNDELISPVQCRAGRALLQWSQQQLADAAHIGVVTVRQFESGAAELRHATLDVMKRAFEAAGVIFEARGEMVPGGPGVRLAER